MTDETVYSLFDAARNAVKASDEEKAKSLYKRVIEEFPDSVEAGVASRELKELAGEEVKPLLTQSEPETDYGTTVAVAKFVSFVGWVLVFLAFVILVIALVAAGRMGVLAFGPVIGSVVGGLLLVMAGQVTGAIVENTRYTRRIFEILEERRDEKSR